MRFTLASVAALAASRLAAAQKKHGEGAEGTEMGPVAFMWPPDRIWDAAHDNTAPCGTAAGVGARSIFPITQGSVALTVADDADNVSFFISFSENPTQQSDFQQSSIVPVVADVDPGHQCYRLGLLPPTVAAGTKATLQLQYISTFAGENNNQPEPFYACADIVFVDTKDFNIQVPCFNVTSDDFTPPTAMPAASAAPSVSPSGGDGLSGGAKAGIAVGTVIGSLAVVGAIAFFVLRRRRSSPNDFELAPRTKSADEADSARSRH